MHHRQHVLNRKISRGSKIFYYFQNFSEIISDYLKYFAVTAYFLLIILLWMNFFINELLTAVSSEAFQLCNKCVKDEKMCSFVLHRSRTGLPSLSHRCRFSSCCSFVEHSLLCPYLHAWHWQLGEHYWKNKSLILFDKWSSAYILKFCNYRGSLIIWWYRPQILENDLFLFILTDGWSRVFGRGGPWRIPGTISAQETAAASLGTSPFHNLWLRNISRHCDQCKLKRFRLKKQCIEKGGLSWNFLLPEQLQFRFTWFNFLKIQ